MRRLQKVSSGNFITLENFLVRILFKKWTYLLFSFLSVRSLLAHLFPISIENLLSQTIRLTSLNFVLLPFD